MKQGDRRAAAYQDAAKAAPTAAAAATSPNRALPMEEGAMAAGPLPSLHTPPQEPIEEGSLLKLRRQGTQTIHRTGDTSSPSPPELRRHQPWPFPSLAFDLL